MKDEPDTVHGHAWQCLCCAYGTVTYVEWLQRFFGTAVGKGRQGAKTDIERLDLKELSCKDAIKEIAKM